MPFRKVDWGPALVAGNLEARAASQKAPPTASSGSAAGAKVLAARWTKGREGQQPSETSAAPWFVGQQSFSELRKANAGVFDDWDKRFSGATDIGYQFRPPPPEPAKDGSSTAALGDSGGAQPKASEGAS